MYQALVLGLGVLLVGGIGYFINHSDQAGVLSSAIVEETSSSTAESMRQSLPGTYVCDVDSKCPNPRVLTLSEEGNAIMTTTYENGAEVVEEQGTWNTTSGGKAVIFLTGNAMTQYGSPYTLLTKYVNPWTIVGGAGGTYKDWTNSIWRKKEGDSAGEENPQNSL